MKGELTLIRSFQEKGVRAGKQGVRGV